MKRRSVIAVVAVVATLGLGIGAAFAYLTATGHGSGAATNGTAPTVTIQAVASGSPNSTLLPGSTADLLVQVQNPSTFTLKIVGIAQNGTATPEGGSGCTSSNDGVTVPTQTGLSMSLAPGTQVLHFSGAAAMSTSSSSGCQGATFDVPVTLTVQQP